MHPPAVDAATAVGALARVDWTAVAAAVREAPRSHKTKTRSGRVRTAEECRLRWSNYDMPGSADVEVWSKTEDMTIMEQATIRRGREWVEVAKMVNECEEGGGGGGGGGSGGGGGLKRRTPVACLRRFQGALNNDLVRWNKWSDREDALLLNAVTVRDWLAFAACFVCVCLCFRWCMFQPWQAAVYQWFRGSIRECFMKCAACP